MHTVLLTFLTRSKWTSPGGSGRTLLFRHPITSPWAAAQSATLATRSPASSPQQPIQHSQGIQRPGWTHTRAKRSWINADYTPPRPWWPGVSSYTSWTHPAHSRASGPQVHGCVLGKSHRVCTLHQEKLHSWKSLLLFVFSWWARVWNTQPGCTGGKQGSPWGVYRGPISDDFAH